LIGLDSSIAKDRLEGIYNDLFGFNCNIEIIDNLIVFKPILEDYSFLKISEYILCPTITFINNNDIIKTIISNQTVHFNYKQFLEENNINDENIIVESVFASYELYSKQMIENEEIFNIFVNRNANVVPIKKIEIEKIIEKNHKSVKYIWKGDDELYKYIGRNDISLIEYIFIFDNEYFKAISIWYIDEN
jgi:hypothetical protein